MKRFGLIALAAFLVLLSAASLEAADYMIVESKSVPAGATDVTVSIRVANSDTLQGLSLPLEIRSLTPGSRPTALRLGYADRLESRMDDFRIVNQYDTKNGFCQHSGESSYWVPLTMAGDTTVPVTHSPWAVAFATFRISIENALYPGADSTGSLLLYMDVSDVPGSFEIDTVCLDPAVHIGFVISVPSVELPNGVSPSFTKGVITISGCDCSHHGDLDGDGQITALDIGLLIDYLFAGGDAPPRDSDCPHVDRGDLDCDGSDTSLDLSHMVDFLFAGGPPPCDPCDCDPYPASCP